MDRQPVFGLRRVSVGVLCIVAAALVGPNTDQGLAQSAASTDLSKPTLFSPSTQQQLDALECHTESLTSDPGNPERRVWAGLALAQCDLTEQAVELLSTPTPTLDQIDHWRFVVWAESLLALNRGGDLAADFVNRPTWVQDQLRAPYARYLSQHDPARFWLQYQPQLLNLTANDATEVDEMAWELAVGPSEQQRRKRIALRLLIHSPVQASLLKVVETLRHPDGLIPWPRLLSADSLTLRAENLIESGIPQGALVALDEVGVSQRDDRWRLARARALTLNRQGAQAWTLLEPLVANGEQQQLSLLWARADAALDASKVRRGRTNLGSTMRAVMRDRGHHQLDLIAATSPDLTEQANSIRRRIADLDDDDSVEEVTSLTMSLAQLDPTDVSAERWLWARGWKQYQARNWTGAADTWRQLLDIYPRGRQTDRAWYWLAKAHSHLGNRERAQELWLNLASSPVDHYYAQRAREQITAPVTPRGERFDPDPLPDAPQFRLANWFARAGLSALARRELERQTGVPDHPVGHVLLARIESDLGNHRTSIQHIWRAYKGLGTAQESTAPRFAHELYYPREFEQPVVRQASRVRLDPKLVWAMIRQESAFDVAARSRAGARGLMQLMPGTAREQARMLGMRYSQTNLHDPDYNIRLGSSYFRRVLDMFDGRLELALAGYNSGPYRMKKWVNAAGTGLQLDSFIEELPFEETRTYVRRVVQFKGSYQTLYPEIETGS